MPQHYRITIEDAIALYRSGDLTAKGTLKIYFRIKLAEGWQLKIEPSEIRELFSKTEDKPMPKSTFWKALNELQEEGEIDFDEPKAVVIRRVSRIMDEVQNNGQVSKIMDEHPESWTDDQNNGQVSKIMDEQTPEPPQDGDCGKSPNYSQSSYQIFINSLSDDERENFLNFCQYKTKGYKTPIVNWDDYLSSRDAAGQERWIEIRNEWLKNKAIATTAIVNPVIKGVDEKAIKSIEVDQREQLIQRLNQDWGKTTCRRLVSAIVDGYVYLLRSNNPLTLEQALTMTSDELKSIAEGNNHV